MRKVSPVKTGFICVKSAIDLNGTPKQVRDVISAPHGSLAQP
jgi:hypothetical protein